MSVGFGDAEGACAGEEADGGVGAVGPSDLLVFDVDVLLDTPPVATAGLGRTGAGGGDSVDGEPAEVAQQVLVMDAARTASQLSARIAASSMRPSLASPTSSNLSPNSS